MSSGLYDPRTPEYKRWVIPAFKRYFNRYQSWFYKAYGRMPSSSDVNRWFDRVGHKYLQVSHYLDNYHVLHKSRVDYDDPTNITFRYY